MITHWIAASLALKLAGLCLCECHQAMWSGLVVLVQMFPLFVSNDLRNSGSLLA